MGWDWSTPGLESYMFTIIVPTERGQTLSLPQECWDDPSLTARDDSFRNAEQQLTPSVRPALSSPKLRKPLAGASMAARSEPLLGALPVHRFCLACLALQVLQLFPLWTTCSDSTTPCVAFPLTSTSSWCQSAGFFPETEALLSIHTLTFSAGPWPSTSILTRSSFPCFQFNLKCSTSMPTFQSMPCQHVLALVSQCERKSPSLFNISLSGFSSSLTYIFFTDLRIRLYLKKSLYYSALSTQG